MTGNRTESLGQKTHSEQRSRKSNRCYKKPAFSGGRWLPGGAVQSFHSESLHTSQTGIQHPQPPYIFPVVRHQAFPEFTNYETFLLIHH